MEENVEIVEVSEIWHDAELKQCPRNWKDETNLHNMSGEWSIGLKDMLDSEKKDRESR